MSSNSNLFIRIVNSFSGLASDQPGIFATAALNITPRLVGIAARNNFYGYNIINPNTVDCWVKCYDSYTAPVVGTDFVYFKIQVPANGSVVLFGSDMIESFSAGFYIAATTGYLNSDTGAPALDLEARINFKQ